MDNHCMRYFAPEMEMLPIEVEQGFALSNMEPIEEEKPEQYW